MHAAASAKRTEFKGNGTQSIVWQINEETYRQKLDTEGGGTPPATPGMQVYYGSVHDVLSYPCEVKLPETSALFYLLIYPFQDGKLGFVQAASVSIHRAHGQYIENVHLQPYGSESHFWDVLYKEQYGRILRKAEDFLKATGGGTDGDKDGAMIFIRQASFSFPLLCPSRLIVNDYDSGIAVAWTRANTNTHPCPGTIARCPPRFITALLATWAHSLINTRAGGS